MKKAAVVALVVATIFTLSVLGSPPNPGGWWNQVEVSENDVHVNSPTTHLKAPVP